MFKKRVTSKYLLVEADFKSVVLKFQNQGHSESEVKKAIERFKTLRDQKKIKDVSHRDIEYWGKKSFDEFEWFVDGLMLRKSNTQQREEKRGGAELVGESDKWRVYYISTQDACVYYGYDTKWCITDKDIGKEKWDEYTQYGNFYYLISKTHPAKHPLSKIVYFEAPGGYVEVGDSTNALMFAEGVPEEHIERAMHEAKRSRSEHTSLPDDVPKWTHKPFTAQQKQNLRNMGFRDA